MLQCRPVVSRSGSAKRGAPVLYCPTAPVTVLANQLRQPGQLRLLPGTDPQATRPATLVQAPDQTMHRRAGGCLQGANHGLQPLLFGVKIFEYFLQVHRYPPDETNAGYRVDFIKDG